MLEIVYFLILRGITIGMCGELKGSADPQGMLVYCSVGPLIAGHTMRHSIKKDHAQLSGEK